MRQGKHESGALAFLIALRDFCFKDKSDAAATMLDVAEAEAMESFVSIQMLPAGCSSDSPRSCRS